MQKIPLQYGEIIFQSKVIPLFLPKFFKFHHSEMYTIYGILQARIQTTATFATANLKKLAKKYFQLQDLPLALHPLRLLKS